MVVLLPSCGGCDEVGDALSQVAVVFGTILRNRFLDELSLIRYAQSARVRVFSRMVVPVRSSKPVRHIFRP
jgi:hypothetical protein